MTKEKKRKARWFGLAFAAFGAMCTVGSVYLWICPLCIAAMAACVRKGGLTEWGGIK